MMLAAILSLALTRADGLKVTVSPSNAQPSLLVFLPGHAEPDVEVLFPEHVTVRKHGEQAAEHLYLFRPGAGGARPQWQQTAISLGYERELPNGIHMLARATLQNDGVL